MRKGRKREIPNHLSIDEIDSRIKKVVGYWRVRRWMVIRQAITEDVSTIKIAKRFGVSHQYVLQLIGRYRREGISGVEVPGRGQRQKAYLTLEEEAAFLKPFITSAKQGHLVTSHAIHKAYNQKVGRIVAKTTIYRLLRRHNWRKITPRPAHVKSNKAAQDSFKKTLN